MYLLLLFFVICGGFTNWLIENGIGAKGFIRDITESDIDGPALKFTFGGKKVLKRLKKVGSDKPEF